MPVRGLQHLTAVLGTAVVLTAVFALLGVAMTPNWRVEPNTTHIAVQSPDTSIAAKAIRTDHEGRYAVKTTTLHITLSGGTTISALLREPVGAAGRRPACMFIEGAGTGTSTQVFGDVANAMASAGIVTLVPDKRLDNYTPLHRDYQAMADDYMDSLNLLRQRASVDPSHTGIYAESEGTWIASVMAQDHPDIGFMILTSPPVVSGRYQMAMAATRYMQYINAPEPMTRDISKIIGMDFSSIGLQYADFPAQRYRSSLTMPLLVNFGTQDISMPIEQGAQMLLHDAGAAGNHNVTLRYYPANHQMRIGSHNAQPGLPLDPRYTRDLENWLNAVASGAKADSWQTPMIAGAQPHQPLAVPEHIQPGLIHSPTVVLAIAVLIPLLLLIAVIGALVSGIAALVTSKRRRRHSGELSGARHLRERNSRSGRNGPHSQHHRLTAPLLVNALCTVASTATLGWYLVIVVKAAISLDDHAAGLTSWWQILRILTLLSVLLLAWLLVSLVAGHTRPAGRVVAVHRFGHVVIVGCVLAAAVLSLTMMAFWGVFSI